MGLFGNISKTVKSYVDQKASDRKFEEQLEKEARAREKEIYAEEYRKNSLEAAKIKAHRDAYERSGLAKLRAINRSHDLDNGKPTINRLDKLREYTQANIKRREENLKRTNELREAGKNMNTLRKATQPVRPTLINRRPMGLHLQHNLKTNNAVRKAPYY